MDLGEFHRLVAERRQLDLQLLDVISGLDWQESGYRHLWQFLMHAMRITRAEAKRWEHHVDVLPRAFGRLGADSASGRGGGTPLPTKPVVTRRGWLSRAVQFRGSTPASWMA